MNTAILLATVATLSGATAEPLRGVELLNELQHRAFRFFWDETHPETGFTKDRAANFKDTCEFNVSSVACTGFALAAYPIGVERRWVDRNAALQRTRLTFRNLYERHDHYKGWFAHWVYYSTGKRAWNCEYSTIDTSILLGGMVVAERYWQDPEVTRWFDRIVRRIDWDTMRTQGGKKPDSKLIYHGFRPESGGYLTNSWGGGGYSEEKMLYVQALGFHPAMPEASFDAIVKNVHDFRGIQIITGGPLFIHQMSESFYNFSELRCRQGFNYWVATRNAILANRLYCIENPKRFKGYGPTFWGLSACDGPDGYKAYGAPVWIEDDGTVNPTAGIAAITHTRREAMQLAEGLWDDYQYALGRYGFANGINPTRDWKTPDVIGIELGMMLLAIENYRTGLIHRLSHAHPAIRTGMRRAGLRHAPNSNNGPLRVQR